MPWLGGNYTYGSTVIDDQRYAVIRNADVIVRVRRVLPNGNQIIWETGDALTDEVIEVIAKASYPQISA